MVRLDLSDRVEIQPGGEGIRLSADGEPVPGGRENLAWRAADLFCGRAGLPGNLEIRIRKRIPVAAGLGGGSSDAAAVLAALNGLFQAGYSEDSLREMGGMLGSDVPFFLFPQAALARGRGERLIPVNLPKPMGFLLVVPPFRISTPWSYETFDRLTGGKKKGGMDLRDCYASLEELLPVLKNDLEIPALSRYPDIGRVKEDLLRLGAKGALMSGSGPVTFGLFPSREGAEEAAGRMKLPEGWRSIVAESH